MYLKSRSSGGRAKARGSARRRSALALGVALALAAGCERGPTGPGGSRPIEELPRELTATEAALVGAGNSFAFDLLREVNAGEEEGRNIFLSPLSASMALGMTLNGARGETFDAMRQVLGFDGLDQGEINRSYRTLLDLLLGLDPGVAVGIANSVWYDRSVTPKDEFRAALEEGFDSKFEGLDFRDPAAVATVNGWVSEATNGRIPRIIDSIDTDELMLLINAIHFKASWTQQFDKKKTSPGTFLVEGQGALTVDMMRSEEMKFRSARTPEGAIAEIPYAGGAFTMTILLPAEEESLDDLIARLDAESWEGLIGRLGGRREGVLSLPRFRLEYEASLDDALKALGMGIAFDDRADLTGIFDRRTQISRVVQKTFVEVDEEGAEAAAATAVGIVPTSGPPVFNVDRSFLFAIRERLTGTILFIGKVVDPAAG